MSHKHEGVYDGRDRATNKLKRQVMSVDLIFGSNSELRAGAEVYGADDAPAIVVEDFVNAWGKVMMLDRYDVRSSQL